MRNIKTTVKVTIALLLTVFIIVAAMQISIRMTETRMATYAESEFWRNSAAINGLTDDLFISDDWIFNSYLSGMTDVRCGYDSAGSAWKIRHTLSPHTLSTLTVDGIYRRLKSFMEYNDDYVSVVMIFEPHVIPDAPDGIAAMINSGDTTRHLLPADTAFFHSAFYQQVRLYDRPRRSAGFTSEDSLWVMTTAVPLFDESGRVIGEFWVNWSNSRSSQMLSSHHAGRDLILAIIDSNGRIIASYDTTSNSRPLREVAMELVDKSLADVWCDDVRQHLSSGDSSSFTNRLNDEIYVTRVSNIRHSDLKLLFVKPERQIYSTVRHFTHISYLIMAVSILLISVCLIYIFHVFRRKNEETLRMESELDTASAIQRSILPPNPDNTNLRVGYDIYGLQRPAKSVGGDLYDFVRKGDLLHFCIGDVSGKGMPAALVMTELCSLYRYIVSHQSDPQEIVTAINRAVMERNDDSMFCTLFVGVLNLNTGLLEFCNAGHNPPIFIHDSAARYLTIRPNMPVNAFPDFVYQKEALQLHKGDRLFLYTDGVTEARDESDHFYGDEATLATITRLRHKPFGELVQGVIADLRAFTRKAEQNDDITMLCVEYNGFRIPAEPATDNLHFDSVKGRVIEIVDAILSACRHEEDMRLRLAIEEPVQNIADYAYDDDGPLDVAIDGLTITLIDSGRPFNPLESDTPDLAGPIAERNIGGLGIHFTRTIMSEVLYAYENNQNKLILKFI